MTKLFGIPNGADFPRTLAQGLISRFGATDPMALARVTVIVNTHRMRRRVIAAFAETAPRLLPKILVLSDLIALARGYAPKATQSTLKRKLDLIPLILRLIDSQPDLAARSSVYDLADSLVSLMDEMVGEGVGIDAFETLQVSDLSGHWDRALQFFKIAYGFLGEDGASQGSEGQMRALVIHLIEQWRDMPPDGPIILAGSTGSRGATFALMTAIAGLDQGMLVLPGFDFEMPLAGWNDLNDATTGEDHPQYRFAKLMNMLDTPPDAVARWTEGTGENTARNALVSLALRPAPVTDCWMSEGPSLRDLSTATKNITYLEAEGQRAEAMAIALRLREAAEKGETAALITPDRTLTRRVTAALAKWDIVPDDSAGQPLHLAAAGRFWRMVGKLIARQITAADLVTLLKHPITHSASDRGPHQLMVQEFELYLRDKNIPFPDPATITAWCSVQKHEIANDWAHWISTIYDLAETPPSTLQDRLTHHRTLAELVARGSVAKDGSGELWLKKPGQKARQVIESLTEAAASVGEIDLLDYTDLVTSVLQSNEVRDRDGQHPNILIWGTLEARVQGADVMILAGLNDGTWPSSPSADPWLNRQMRHDLGLLLPERRIGLSAHDFQQAFATEEVWITRSVRGDDAETIPSRWLNRLFNLLRGLNAQEGQKCYDAMLARGNKWLAKVKEYEKVTPVSPVARPAPCPPVASRPDTLSITDIEKLIRDAYGIYAKRVLKLRPLNPIDRPADAMLKGELLHKVMEEFIKLGTLDKDALIDTAQRVLSADRIPWAVTRHYWIAHIDKIAEEFIAEEQARQRSATPTAFEAEGKITLPLSGVKLNGRADRIDRTEDGSWIAYDYKTGRASSVPQQKEYDKQLLLTAAMIEDGAFTTVDPAPVIAAEFLKLKAGLGSIKAPLDEEPTDSVREGVDRLLNSFNKETQGYPARGRMAKTDDKSDYDHLSRHGEWDITQAAQPEVIK